MILAALSFHRLLFMPSYLPIFARISFSNLTAALLSMAQPSQSSLSQKHRRTMLHLLSSSQEMFERSQYPSINAFRVIVGLFM